MTAAMPRFTALQGPANWSWRTCSFVTNSRSPSVPGLALG